MKYGEPLKRYTTLRIGGRADWLIEPKNDSEMKQLLEMAQAEYFLVCFGAREQSFGIRSGAAGDGFPFILSPVADHQ